MPDQTAKLRTEEEWVRRLLVACMAVGLLSLVAAGIAAAWSTGRNEEHTRWVNHTYEVELAIDRASVAIERSETARRGYLLTSDPAYLATYRTTAAAIGPAVDRIARLTADNPRQQRNIAAWRLLIADFVARRDRTIGLVTGGRAAAAVHEFGTETGARRMRGIRNLAAAMTAEERQLLVLRDDAQRASVRLFYTVLAIAGGLLIFVAVVSLAAVLRFTRDLGASRDRLRLLNETLEDQVATRTADLSRANEEIQRFAYIVSHDLRSPLVNVMGFTAEMETATASLDELVGRAEADAPHILTEEARLAAREDLPEAIGFIRTSTQKMDRLINAILKLSREGRRVITPEPIDLGALVDEIGGSIRHIVEERGITLTVERPMPALVTDRVALEQILSNLIENAAKYLQPGRPGVITVSGKAQRGRVIVAVADNGRGIDPRDHARVFDLFRRSGQQDQPGEGIGLAHVRALAYRLGGTIDVDSELGTGSTFSLNLPATFDLQEKTA